MASKLRTSEAGDVPPGSQSGDTREELGWGYTRKDRRSCTAGKGRQHAGRKGCAAGQSPNPTRVVLGSNPISDTASGVTMDE